MPNFEITVTFDNNTERNNLRMNVVEQLSKELCGKGKGDKATHYIYYVEILSNGNRIYLKRPAWVNNGFDFVVCVENTNFNTVGKYRNNPSHNDILNDIKKKKKENTQMRSVWSIPTPKNNEKEFGKHPTQKPLDLLLRIIMASTDEGDIILDPFNGGGTTGIASSIIGNRFYIGIEIDNKYCKLTKDKLLDLKKEPMLFQGIG
jgi:hypothetical protein